MNLADDSFALSAPVHRKINGAWYSVVLPPELPQGYEKISAGVYLDSNTGNVVSFPDASTQTLVPDQDLLDLGAPTLTDAQATFNWLLNLQNAVEQFADPNLFITGAAFDPSLASHGAEWTRWGLKFLASLSAPGASAFITGTGVNAGLFELARYANHYPNVLMVYLQFLDFLAAAGKIRPLDLAAHTALANAAASAATALAANEDAASAAAHSSFFEGLKSLLPVLTIALPLMAPSLMPGLVTATADTAGAVDTAAAAASISPEAFASYGQAVEAGSMASESVAFAAQATLPEEITAAIANANGAALTATAAAQDAVLTAASTAEPGNAVGDFFKSIGTKITDATPTQIMQIGKQAVALMSTRERERHTQLTAQSHAQHAASFRQAGGTPEQYTSLQLARAAKAQNDSGAIALIIGAGLLMLLLT